jgi:hypothetical protein
VTLALNASVAICFAPELLMLPAAAADDVGFPCRLSVWGAQPNEVLADDVGFRCGLSVWGAQPNEARELHPFLVHNCCPSQLLTATRLRNCGAPRLLPNVCNSHAD